MSKGATKELCLGFAGRDAEKARGAQRDEFLHVRKTIQLKLHLDFI